jgi:O-antigen/teichoic acid export membrane protein
VITGVLSVAVVHRRLFPVRIVWSLRRYWMLLTEARVLAVQLFIMNFGIHAENLLVPKLVGIPAHGFFAAGSLLPRRLEVVPDGLNTAFFPVMARSYHVSAREGARSVLRLILIMLGACLPVAIAVFILADPLSRILFPADAELCRTIIRITIWWVPCVGLAYAMGYALNAAGRERDEARLAIAGTVASLVLSVVLIVKFGLIGACIGLVAKGAIGALVRVKSIIDILRLESPAIPSTVVEPSAVEQSA